MPEDFSNLVRHKDASELLLNLVKVEFETSEILSVVRREASFHLDEFVYALHKRCVRQIKLTKGIK